MEEIIAVDISGSPVETDIKTKPTVKLETPNKSDNSMAYLTDLSPPCQSKIKPEVRSKK